MIETVVITDNWRIM